MRRVVQTNNPDLYLQYVGREASAAAAAGYYALHVKQQQEFIEQALNPTG
jgi:2-oxoglutarate dehydrogenase E1 component